MKPGQKTFDILNTVGGQPVVSSIVLVNVTSMVTPIAVNERRKIEISGAFTLGATGGFRFNLAVPAGGVVYNVYWKVREETTPLDFEDIQVANADFTNASAVASNYWLTMTANIINGATAGNVQLLFAQNNSTANPITLLRGMTIECSNF